MNSRAFGDREDWKEWAGTAWDDNSLAKLLAKIPSDADARLGEGRSASAQIALRPFFHHSGGGLAPATGSNENEPGVGFANPRGAAAISPLSPGRSRTAGSPESAGEKIPQ